MKFFYSVPFLFLISISASAQDVIYQVGGERTPAKVVSVTADKIKYKKLDNLTGPDYSKALNKVLVAFNASGNYLVFNDTPIEDSEKELFVSGTPTPRGKDIIVDIKGGITTLDIAAEKGTSITGSIKNKAVKIPKSVVVFIIRKNGTHQLFVPVEKAMGYLNNAKAKIARSTGDEAIVEPAANPIAVANTGVAKNNIPAAAPSNADDMVVDIKLFSKKAEMKIDEFNSYVNAICQVNTERELAKKSINLAVDLFVSEGSKVEISSINSEEKVTRPIRVYLERLQLRSKQYSSVKVQYANINYASKFTKGADGNYYATITFMQRFQGFLDGKVVYGDKTKRNVQVVLKQYEKSVSGEIQKGWDVFFDDMGVLETRRS